MFCVVDLETTGTNPSSSSILTGTFIAVNSALTIVSMYKIKCRPWKWTEEAEQAAHIHGITKEMTETWPTFHDQVPDLMRFFKDHELKYFVCHAKRDAFGKMVTFDHAMLKMALFPTDEYWFFLQRFPESKIISTHSLAKYFQADYDFQKRDLKSVAQSLGVALTKHHDDEADAMACYGIFKKLYPRVNLDEFLDQDFYKLGGKDDDTKKTSRGNTKKPIRLQDTTSIF